MGSWAGGSTSHSPPNLKTSEEERLGAYLPHRRFRHRDPHFEQEHKQRQRGSGAEINQLVE